MFSIHRRIVDHMDTKLARRTRGAYRSQLVKKINELDAELSKEDPDQTVVQVKVELISEAYEKVDYGL